MQQNSNHDPGGTDSAASAKMRTFILFFVYIILALLLIPVLFICFLFRWPQPIVFYGKTAVLIGLTILGIKREISGRDNFRKDTTYIFMANHLSMLDGPMLITLIPQFVRVIAKEELFKVPILGHGMKIVGFISVDRKGQQSGKKSIAKAAALIRNRACSFLVFPEGTRSRDGSLQQFRRGGFYMALHSGVPIVPVSVSGAYELMPKGSFFIKKGKVKLYFSKPVASTGYTEDNLSGLITEVREKIALGIERIKTEND